MNHTISDCQGVIGAFRAQSMHSPSLPRVFRTPLESIVFRSRLSTFDIGASQFMTFVTIMVVLEFSRRR